MRMGNCGACGLKRLATGQSLGCAWHKPEAPAKDSVEPFARAFRLVSAHSQPVPAPAPPRDVRTFDRGAARSGKSRQPGRSAPCRGARWGAARPAARRPAPARRGGTSPRPRRVRRAPPPWRGGFVSVNSRSRSRTKPLPPSCAPTNQFRLPVRCSTRCPKELPGSSGFAQNCRWSSGAARSRTASRSDSNSRMNEDFTRSIISIDTGPLSSIRRAAGFIPAVRIGYGRNGGRKARGRLTARGSADDSR